MQKDEMRKTLREMRQVLTEDDVEILSYDIGVEFEQWWHHQKIKDIKACLIYLPIKSQKEVDTSRIIQFLLRNDVKVLVPHMLDSEQMATVHYSENQRPGPFGPDIIDPVEYKGPIELGVLPGLGFSMGGGHRIGYGKGHWDKFLSQNNVKTTIGLAYGISLFASDALKMESTDYPVDFVIYEKAIHCK